MSIRSQTRRRWPVALVALVVSSACGDGEPAPGGATEHGPRDAPRAGSGQARGGPQRAGPGAGQVPRPGQASGPPAWEPGPVEVVEVDPRTLPDLFSDRLPPPTEAVTAHMRLFRTGDTNWPTEAIAERCEAALVEYLSSALAGGSRLARRSEARGASEPIAASGTGEGIDRDERPPADDLIGVGGGELPAVERGPRTELRAGALETVLYDGAVSVRRRPGGSPHDAAPDDDVNRLLGELRTTFRAGPPELDLRITSISGTRDPVTAGECVLVHRCRGCDGCDGPAQVTLAFEARWSGGAGGLALDELVVTEVEEVRARSVGFAELTPWLLGDTDFYRAELLRGVDDYFMRIDRQAGSAFQGMQGLAVGDVDGDGLEDVYLCTQVGLPNRLLIKRPDGSVVERAAEARLQYLDVGRAALIVDLDGDGDRDLALAAGPELVVAYNDGTGVFPDQIVLRAEGPEQIYSLTAADPDLDGDLDLYAGRYALEGVMHGVPTPYHDASNGSTNTFWRNDGPGRFTDATAEVGLDQNNTRFTLAAIWDDFDGDGAPDLYVVNDFGRNNLFRNDGAGHFEDLAEAVGALDIGAGMGAAVADYDLDGDPDIYVTNMFSAPGLRITAQADRFMGGRHGEVHRWYGKHARGNSLLANRGDGSFEDVTDAARVARARWAWGGVFTDLDNDGREDLYVPCGHATRRGATRDLEAFFWHRVISSSPPEVRADEGYAAAFAAVHRMVMYDDYSWCGEERNLVWLNAGGGRFVDVSAVSGLDWPDDSRSAALVDWDEDGRVDVLLKSRNAPRLRFLHNRWGADDGTGRWIAFELVGTRCNRDAVGALVEVEVTEGASRRVLTRRVRAGDGFLSQSSLRPHFGLGAAATVRVAVHWPGGEREDFGALESGRRWRLVEESGVAGAIPRRMAGAAAKLAALEHREGEWDPEPVTRVPLAARLPLAALPAPSFVDPGRRLADLAGRPALVLLYSAAHPGGEAALSRLAARAAELEASGLQVVPLAVDEGTELARARELAARYGLGSVAGYADGRARQAYEIAFLEVLGFFHSVPSPSALLLDPSGSAVVLYLGPPDPEVVLSDLGVMASYGPRRGGTGRFGGGHWLVPRRRDLAGLARVFEARGYADIGRFYASLAD